MKKAPFCSTRKGFIWWNIKLPLSPKRNGKSHHADAVMVESPADWRRRPTPLSSLSFCVCLRSAPPWTSAGRRGPQPERDGGGCPRIRPEGSQTTGNRPRTPQGRRGSHESGERSSPPEGRRYQSGKTAIRQHKGKFLSSSGQDHLTLNCPLSYGSIFRLFLYFSIKAKFFPPPPVSFLGPTLVVAIKRVKMRRSVLLDTGSQWVSWRVKRMAPYRLALVGLQTQTNK